MALVRAGGYGHRIFRMGVDDYRIVWYYDVKAGRLRSSRKTSRDTNRRGAERFAKKWGVTMPEEPK